MVCIEGTLPVILTFAVAILLQIQIRSPRLSDMDEVSMDLFRPDDQIPRFTVHILDQKLKGSNGKFAVFIVPQGRSVCNRRIGEWFFV